MLPCVTEAADSNRAINDRRQLLNCGKAVGLFEQCVVARRWFPVRFGCLMTGERTF
jgi:hypothetical protein